MMHTHQLTYVNKPKLSKHRYRNIVIVSSHYLQQIDINLKTTHSKFHVNQEITHKRVIHSALISLTFICQRAKREVIPINNHVLTGTGQRYLLYLQPNQFYIFYIDAKNLLDRRILLTL